MGGILVLTLFFIVGCQSIEFLQFEQVGKAVQDQIFMLTDDTPTVHIDATLNRQRTVYFAQRSPAMEQELTFHCLVNKQNVSLSKISLCCRENANNPEKHCSLIPKHTQEGILSCLDVSFRYTMDPLSGAVFSIFIPKHSNAPKAIAGFFSCIVAKNEDLTLESNDIELRDAVYYTRQLNTAVSHAIDIVEPLKSSQFPYNFDCMDDQSTIKNWPTWLQNLDSKYGPYKWGHCSVADKLNAFTCVRHSSPLSPEVSITFINGSMFITDRGYFNSNKIALVCYTVGEQTPVKTYAQAATSDKVPDIKSPISIDPTKEVGSSKLQALTATYSNFTIQKGTDLNGFVLKALYKEPDAVYTHVWKKGNEKLPPKAGTKFTYQFTSTADESLTGLYRLTITKSDRSDSLEFRYDILIVSPPVLKQDACPNGLQYIMEGGKFTSTCEFDNRWNAQMYVGIDSVESSNDGKLRKALVDRYRYSNQELSKLEINYYIENTYNRYNKLHLNLPKLQMKQDFKLSLRVQSDYGQAHVSSSLRVVPKPKLIVSPSGQNCDKDCDILPYNVSCVIDPQLITQWKTEYGIDVQVGWVVQNQWSIKDVTNSNGLNNFFSLDGPMNSVLTVWPNGKSLQESEQVVEEQPQMDEPDKSDSNTNKLEKQNEAITNHSDGDNDSKNGDENNDHDETQVYAPSRTLKQYIAQQLGGQEAHQPSDLILRCWISLAVLEKEAKFSPILGLKRITRQSSTSSNGGLVDQSRIIYDSRWETDPNVLQYMTMKRRFTTDIPTATANLAWLSAVIIGIIVLLVVIVLSMWLCSRDRGETYMVYDKERAYGNDPIQELKEKETFQTFQRQEEPPIASSRYSLDGDSMHVGSEDDGELDEYAGGDVPRSPMTDEQERRKPLQQQSSSTAARKTQSQSKHQADNTYKAVDA